MARTKGKSNDLSSVHNGNKPRLSLSYALTLIPVLNELDLVNQPLLKDENRPDRPWGQEETQFTRHVH